jgi:ubiquinone/menaquinone biosynthesis C-methylase UbiE
MFRGLLTRRINSRKKCAHVAMKLICGCCSRDTLISLEREQDDRAEGVNKVNEQFWERYFLSSMIAGWSRAEATVESICKILGENGIVKGNILDLCCGTGRLSVWLAKKGFKAVGLDISQLYLEEAWRRANEFGVEAKVKFLLGDMREVDKIVGSKSPFDCTLNFWNAMGYWGDDADEMIFTKVRRMTKEGGVLIIGECDHIGQLMYAFDERRVFDHKDAIIIEDATMDFISSMFRATFRYYTKEGDCLKYFDSFDYQVRVYSVSEISSLLKRAGWKVTGAYENIETLQPFTNRAIFKGDRSMSIVAKAV